MRMMEVDVEKNWEKRGGMALLVVDRKTFFFFRTATECLSMCYLWIFSGDPWRSPGLARALV